MINIPGVGLSFSSELIQVSGFCGDGRALSVSIKASPLNPWLIEILLWCYLPLRKPLFYRHNNQNKQGHLINGFGTQIVYSV